MKPERREDFLIDLEQRAGMLSWEEAAEKIGSLEDEQVLQLLDAASVKIGDTASHVLLHRRLYNRIITALLDNELRSAQGRLRAINTLASVGAALPESIPALVKAIDDRSDIVVDNALCWLAFFRYQPVLSVIKDRILRVKAGSQRQKDLLKAQRALEEGDPFIYFPSFSRADARHLWKLDQEPVWKKEGRSE